TARRGRLGNATAVLALITALMCISPALRAYALGRALPERLSDALPASNAQQGAAFSFLQLFRGQPSSGVSTTEHVYARDGKKELKLDAYRSRDATQPEPLIVMVHGGSWNGSSKAELPAINRVLASRGYVVASINYRHAPKHRFPAAVDDVFRAIDYLRAHAAELHIDATRIVLMGRSAGGQIALSAGYSGRDPAVRGVIAFYTPADLVLGYNEPSRPWVLDSKRVLEDYLGGSPSENPEAYAAASPVNFIRSDTPPTLLIHGLLDPIVWPKQSQVLASRLAQAQRPHFLLELPWATHGCDANLSGPSGQLSLYAIERFLSTVLPSRPAP
ncbi:MAG TPA: alpha/beta hydrolase, partial [Chthoniobacterales bacterium]